MRKKTKKQIVIFASLLSCLGGSMAMASDMNSAVKDYMQGNYAEALPEVNRLARSGNPEAQFALGLAYEHGRSVSLNPIMAMYWYQQAADTYKNMGASIASRFSREAVTRLQYRHRKEQLARNN